MKIIHWIDEKLSVIENTLLICLLSVMVILAFLLVLLRNFFHTGIHGADEFLRHLVLLLAFFGASQGARLQKHITIDVLRRIFPENIKDIISVVVNIFVIVISFWLAYAGWNYVFNERYAGTSAIFGIKVWVYQLIIPVGFVLIAFHFFVHILDSIFKTARRKPE